MNTHPRNRRGKSIPDVYAVSPSDRPRGRTRYAIAQEAQQWFITNRDHPEERQRKQFDEWLRTSRVHMEEYLLATQISRSVARLKGDPAFSIDELLARARTELGVDEDEKEDQKGVPDQPVREAMSGRYFDFVSWLPMAGGVIAACFVVWLHFRTPNAIPTESDVPVVSVIAVPATEEARQFATGRGQNSILRLSDGSVLRLNADTEVMLAFKQDERLISLNFGQAFFEIAHDASRPFLVLAGAVEITDVGTRFDVSVKKDARQSTLVTVLEGQVNVATQGTFGIADGLKPKPNPGEASVGAGQQVQAFVGSPPAAVPHADAQLATAWLRQKVQFNRVALADAVVEFNRHSSHPFEILTPELRTLEVSGVFALDDAQSLIAYLRGVDGVEVVEQQERIVVSRR